MQRRGLVAAVALLTVLAGCGSADDRAKSDGTPALEPSVEPATSSATASQTSAPTTAPPSSKPVPVRQEEAAQALEAGLHGLLGGESVDFSYRLGAGATALIETTGRAAITGGWRSSTQVAEEASTLVDDGEGLSDLRMEVRAPGTTDVFMQMAGWPEPMAGCWLRMGAGQVPVGFLAMTPGVPAYVGVLGAVEALGFADAADGSRIAVSMSLRGALALLTGRSVQAMAVPPEQMKGVRVEAMVYLEDGVVTAVRVSGSDILDGVRTAGGELQTRDAEALAMTHLSVSYTPAPAGADPVTAPDDRLVVTTEEMDADRGC